MGEYWMWRFLFLVWGVFSFSSGPAFADTIAWNNPAGGNWNTATNWSPAAVPGPGDDVQIALAGTYTVTLNTSATINSLTVGGGSGVQTFSVSSSTLSSAVPCVITNNGALLLPGGALKAAVLIASNATATWTGTDLLNTLTIAPGGTLTINGSVTLGYNNNLRHGGGSVTNFGTVVWNSGFIQGYGNARLHNVGLWEVAGSHTMSLVDGTNYFTNVGTLTKTSGTGTSSIQWRFQNTGTINTPTGAFSIGSWTNNSTLNGTCTIDFNPLNSNSTVTVASGATLAWNSGDVLGTLLVSDNATLTIGGSVSLGYNNNLRNAGGSLTNLGTVVWNSGLIQGFGNARIHNAGLWQIAANLNLSNSDGTNYFTNVGTLTKTAGVSTATLGWFFTTTGTLTTSVGNFQINEFNGASTLNGAFTFGLATTRSNATATIANGASVTWISGDLLGGFTVASGGTLTIGGSVSLGYNNNLRNAGGSLTNLGTVVWNSGLIQGFGNARIHNAGLWQIAANLNLSNSDGTNYFTNVGTLTKTAGVSTATLGWFFTTTGTLTTSAGNFQINEFNGASALNGASTFAITTLRSNQTLTVQSGGAATLTGGDILGGVTVAPGGTLTIGGSVSLGYNNNLRNAGGSLTNLGAVVWSSGAIVGYGNAQIHNAGLWNSIANTSLQNGHGTNQFTNAGTLRKSAGISTTTIGWSVTNTGTLDSQTGILDFSGAYTQTGGATRLRINSSGNYGRVSFTGPSPLAGPLIVELYDGYLPTPGNFFNLISYGSLADTYATTDLPAAINWNPQYLATTYRITAQSFNTTLPDLQVTNLVVTGNPSLRSGASVTLQWNTRNTGTGDAGGTWSDRITAVNTNTTQTLYTANLIYNSGSIVSGALAARQYTFSLPDGTDAVGDVRFTVTADINNSVPEGNAGGTAELNNSNGVIAAVTLAPYPDLQITGLNVAEPTPFSGQNITINWNDTNAGDAPTTGAFQDHLIIRNLTTTNLLLSTTVLNTNIIAAGQSSARQYIYKLPDGNLGTGHIEIALTADFYNQIFELTNSNNSATNIITSTLAAYPDLIVTNITAPASGLPGQTVTVSWTTKNQGNATATNAWTEQIFFSNGVYLATFNYNTPLAAGATANRSEQITLPLTGSGDRYFLIKTDVGNSVFELSEANNTGLATAPLNIPTALTVALSPATIGEAGTGSATVTRNGDTTGALFVTLTSSNTAAATVPADVTILSNQTSATFTITGVPDTLVTGSRLANITASAAGQAPGSALLTIADDDTPTLQLAISNASLNESNSNPAATLTVTRNAQLANPLTVTLQSGNPAKLTIPASIIVPANSQSTNVPVTVVDNDIVDGSLNVTLTAAATGFTPASVPAEVGDNDVPQLTLTLADTVVSESAGTPATVATVSRGAPGTALLPVTLRNSDTTAITIPAQVEIPANEASVSFNVLVRDDNLVNGPRTVTLTAIPLSNSGQQLLAGQTNAPLEVLDNDGPTLALQFPAVVAEGETNTATVTRNVTTNASLLVTLASSQPGQVAVPATVTIAANQTTTNFSIIGVTDVTPDGVQHVTITASAPDYAGAARGLSVTDIDLPDLQLSAITITPNGTTGGTAPINWTVTNAGRGPASGPWVDRVYLSRNNQFDGSATLVATFTNSPALAIGEAYTQSPTIMLPETPGEYWLIVTTDAGNAVDEGAELNNIGVGALTIIVDPAYRATVATTVNVAGKGTAIPLTGTAYIPATTNLVPNVPVTVRVLVRGTRRVMTVTTDATGNFATTFQPLGNEAGDYDLAADHPKVAADTVQDSFELIGFTATPDNLTLRVATGTPVTGTIELNNLSERSLTGIAVTTSNAPAMLTANLTGPASIAAGSTAAFTYTLETTATSALGTQIFFRVTSTEGAVVVIPLNVTVVPAAAQLAATPAFLERGMIPGQQAQVQFTLRNNGGAPSGELTVNLPVYSWLSLVSSRTIPSLLPGAETIVTLLLNPPADLPLALYPGSLSIGGALTGVSVPFQFRAMSQAVGDLLLSVTDEYTFYVAGAPLVSNATVTVRDALDGAPIASGVTGTNGTVFLPNITAGDYTIDVNADRHQTGRRLYRIVPGITNVTEIFISRQLVTYRWSVVPVDLEDKYTIVLESVFETEVPVPNVIVENPFQIPLVIPGEETQMELRLRNEGLIAANGVEVVIPSNDRYVVTPLTRDIGLIPARSTVSVPILIRRRLVGEMQAAASVMDKRLVTLDEEPAPQSCELEGPDCAPGLPVGVLYYYRCGGNDVMQQRQADFRPLCTAQATKDCLDSLKEAGESALENRGNLVEAGCDALDALLQCTGAELSPCQEAALKTGCQTIVGGLTGGAGGALAGAKDALGDSLGCLCDLLQPVFEAIGQRILAYGASRVPGGCGLCGGGYSAYNFITSGYGFGSGWNIVWGVPIDITGPDFLRNRNCSEVTGQNLVALPATKRFADAIATAGDLQTLNSTTAGVCARVRIRLEQEAVTTRTAFQGAFELENNGADALTGLQVTLDFRDAAGEPASDKFFFTPPVVTGLGDVTGTGTLNPGLSGSARYLFIPTKDAAPDQPRTYTIGGTLRYFDGGDEVVVPLLGATIKVYPDARLQLVYFQQRDVYSDDPFTSEVEPTEPFTLGLLVKNTGAGAARNLTITSAQPEIIENEKGLLIDFQIIGTTVGTNAVDPSLTVNLGDIAPGTSQVGSWQLTLTLQGKFLEYTATFAHSDDLGGDQTSLIDSVEIHELIHQVQADRVGDDALPDFLVAGAVHMSDGTVAVVNEATGSASPGALSMTLTATQPSGWSYLTIPDPGVGYRLHRVVRSDAKEILVGLNAWTTDRSFPSAGTGAVREWLFHLFDHNGTGSYTLHYRVEDSVAPTMLEITGLADVTFSEPIDLATFDFNDLTLTRNGTTNTLDGSVTIALLSNTTYRINGLTGFATPDGNYTLTVTGDGIEDFGGNPVANSLSLEWAKGDAVAVVASIGPITFPVVEVPVVFTKPILPGSFGTNDVLLTRDGNPVAGAFTITPVSETTFALSLSNLTTVAGNYALTVFATGVEDTDFQAGLGSLTRTWTLDLTPPQPVALSPVNSPRNIVVPSLDVTFSEPVTGTIPVTLTRDGNPVAATFIITPLTPTTYRIANFNWVSGTEGEYALTVYGAGLTDLAGNPGTGTVARTWTMDTTAPATPTNLAIAPDRGVSGTDALTNTRDLTFSANVPVRVFNVTTGSDLGESGAPFTLAAPGSHKLRARAVDAAGNVSPEAFLDIFIDETQPTASIVPIAPNPRATPVSAIDFTVSESVTGTIPVTLTRDGSPVSGDFPVTPLGGNSYRVSNLTGPTGLAGTYEFTVQPGTFTDLAGNPLFGPVTLTLQITGSTPQVDAGPNATIAEGSTFTGNGSFVDPDLNTWTATVNYGDGAGTQALSLMTNKTFALSRMYADDGVYAVAVSVSDGGTTGNDSLTVTVTNLAPAIQIATNIVRNAGNGFCLTGSFTDPGADTWAATVDYGTGPQALTLNADKTFTIGTQYGDNTPQVVVVTVTDDDGGVGTATITIQPHAGAPPSAPPILAIERAGNDAVVRVRGTFGLNYRLEYIGDLTGTVWTPVGAVQGGDCGVLTFTDPGGFTAAKRFYRIVVSAP
ncbi:MAG: hypothetical protein PCFJNLEI_02324 [Verrucomicrobiae bacterium]|nr:hypothetical protein [Verrucomicrobiae bacterium]